MSLQATPPEFQRQLRSVFATMRTLLRETRDGRDSVDDYAAHLEGRISAMARAHEMLMRAPSEGVDLEELVFGELLSQAVPQQKLHIEGPEIRITREPAASLALAFHELAMNAITHGAFATPDGKLEVMWRRLHEKGTEWLQLIWREHDLVLDTDVPPRKGFGYELMERMLPYELNATTSVRLTREGARVELLIPGSTENPIWRPANNE